jgi:hypothetical protein
MMMPSLSSPPALSLRTARRRLAVLVGISVAAAVLATACIVAPVLRDLLPAPPPPHELATAPVFAHAPRIPLAAAPRGAHRSSPRHAPVLVDTADAGAVPPRPLCPLFGQHRSSGVIAARAAAAAASSSAASVRDVDAGSFGDADTLVVVAHRIGESQLRDENLAVLLAVGLERHARYQFVLVVSSSDSSAGATMEQQLLHMTREHANVQVVPRHAASSFDACAWSDVLAGRLPLAGHRRVGAFKRFLLVSTAVRGPLLPLWFRDPWPEVFLGLLSADVPLAGAAVPCGDVRVHGAPLAFSAVLLDHVLSALNCAVFAAAENEASERALLERVRANGHSMRTTLAAWGWHNFSDAAESRSRCLFAAASGDAGADIEPTEMLFHATDRATRAASQVRAVSAMMARPWALPGMELCT